MCRDLTSDKSNLYEFKIVLFNNGDLEEFLLFVHNFNMTPEALVTLGIDAKVQYIFTVVCVEVLRQFDLMSADVEGKNPLTVETIILELCVYFFPVNLISKQKCAMRCVMRKPCVLKVRQYADHFFDINEYLALFPGGKPTEKLL